MMMVSSKASGENRLDFTSTLLLNIQRPP